MQYLSQRLANEGTKARGERSPSGALADSQRERLLNATERLIGQVGCADTSIEAIVKAAGVSSVTFYEHFSDKEACFIAAFDRAVEEARAVLAEAVSRETDWPGRARAGLCMLLQMIEADPGRARMCLVEAQTGGRGMAVRYDAMLDGTAGWMRRNRVLDPAAPEVSGAVEEATVGGVAWLLGERLERGEADAFDTLLTKLIEVVLAPYLDGAQVSRPVVSESS